MKTKILIVDDHPVVRKGMKMYIESESDFTVCGEASNSSEAINLINREDPDLVTVDLSLEKDASGLDLIKAIRSRFPKINILVISMHDESFFAERAIKAGAKGYLMKKEAQETILIALKKILEGGMYISEEINKKIIEKLLHNHPVENDRSVDQLSNKEFEVFQLIGKGLNSKEIGKKLNMSKNTVDSHKRHIKEKLNLRNSQELIRYSVQWSMNQKV